MTEERRGAASVAGGARVASLRALGRAQRTRRALAAAAILIVVALAALARPERPLPLDICVFQRATGLPCLTCGMTRAACAFARGDWARGVAWHPAAAPLLAGLVVGAAWAGAEAIAGRALAPRARRRLLIALAVAAALVCAVLWVARLAGLADWPPAA